MPPLPPPLHPLHIELQSHAFYSLGTEHCLGTRLTYQAKLLLLILPESRVSGEPQWKEWHSSRPHVLSWPRISSCRPEPSTSISKGHTIILITFELRTPCYSELIFFFFYPHWSLKDMKSWKRHWMAWNICTGYRWATPAESLMPRPPLTTASLMAWAGGVSIHITNHQSPKGLQLLDPSHRRRDHQTTHIHDWILHKSVPDRARCV